MEILTWNEIKEKYPNQYVALDNVTTDSDGELESAEVVHNYDFSDALKFNFDGVYTVFWTGELNACPALSLPEVRATDVRERLPWGKICKLYPNQGVGLINVIYRERSLTNVVSACLLITDADWSKLQLRDMCGYIMCAVTGESNIAHAGELEVLL